VKIKEIMNKKLNKKQLLLLSCLTRKEAAHCYWVKNLITYVKHLYSSRSVNTAIVMEAGSGMVDYRDSNLLSAN